MKRFLMITPLQKDREDKKSGKMVSGLNASIYEAVGNSDLIYDTATRFPIIPVINAYADKGETIQVIAITPEYQYCERHFKELEEELAELQARKGFICDSVTRISVAYAGDVASQIEIFHKLLPCFEDNDILYGCMTYGNKPMPIAEMMAMQYAYRVLQNVSIDCLVYGEYDFATAKSRIYDITALVQLDEIVRVLADQKVVDPKGVIDHILSL